MRNQTTFSVSEALKMGWILFKQKPLFYIAVSLVMGIILVIPKIVAELAPSFTIFFDILQALLAIGLTMGFSNLTLKAVDGKKPQFSDLFSQFRLNVFIRSIVMIVVLMIFIGVFFIAAFFVNSFLEIVGENGNPLIEIVHYVIFFFGAFLLIYTMTRFYFGIYLFFDKQANSINALKTSWKITEGNVGRVFLLTLYVGIIDTVGIMFFGIGALISFPITFIAASYAYRKLSLEVDPPVSNSAATASVDTSVKIAPQPSRSPQ